MYISYCSDAEQLTYATVAQLVEYDLAKVGVAGSNPVCRSLIKSNAKALLFYFALLDLNAGYSYCKRARKPVPNRLSFKSSSRETWRVILVSVS